ncbi:hypothetical protein J2S44_001042 [Catenuloplanes niger]|uniref:Uncharacterized protein n=1 Tax=Catenuloplanes niger TaxID=587534 RepID=A0AAE3ZKV3_9ACTN|nr:hypothetical protein [Catenuloplanes niger]
MSGQLVGDEAMPERRIVGVDATGGVDQVRVIAVTCGDRVALPMVVGLLAEPQHPAGHRDGDPVDGQVIDQRVHHFGEISLAKYAAARRRIVLLLQELVAFTQFTEFRRLGRGDPGTVPVIDVGDLQPPLQTRRGDPEILRDLPS